jgi:hypothetical protein
LTPLLLLLLLLALWLPASNFCHTADTRDAVWHGMVNDWEGFRAEEIFLQAHNATGAHNASGRQQHPSELGHSYMADLAVGLLQQTYLELMLQPLTTAGGHSLWLLLSLMGI